MLRQNLQLKLSQKLSPQQIQLMNLIQLSTADFEQKVKQELEENIVLEGSESDSREEPIDSLEQEELDLDSYLDDNPSSYENSHKVFSYNQSPSELQNNLHQHLTNQLISFDLDDESLIISEFLIGSIDENGYIRFSMEEIADDLAFKENLIVQNKEIEKVLLEVIQKMEPFGVGARNLKECILIQLSSLSKNKDVRLASDIVSKSFQFFLNKNYAKIIQKHHINETDLKNALKQLERLSPKPGSAFSNDETVEPIVPDFIVQVEGDSLSLELNQKNSPNLYLSNKYRDIIQAYKTSKNKSKEQKQAISFIKQKLDTAKWFIEAVDQRKETLTNTMQAILDYQKDYFISGDLKAIKPMILKDIAEKIQMDISTVSRVANSKYVSTPYGIKRLKDLFSEAVKIEDGEDISSIKAKDTLKEIINNENKKKPFTDEDLVSILKSKGIPIARRTIAKYRENLAIPIARLRKQL